MPRKINDHAFFAGGKSKESVLAKGCSVKTMTGATGGGKLSEYYDTADKVKDRQEAEVSKMNSQKQPAKDRN